MRVTWKKKERERDEDQHQPLLTISQAIIICQALPHSAPLILLGNMRERDEQDGCAHFTGEKMGTWNSAGSRSESAQVLVSASPRSFS